jgi:hypothetical protein
MTYELPKDGAPDRLRIVDIIINLLPSLDGRDNILLSISGAGAQLSYYYNISLIGHSSALDR